ncbi:MAG: hypothetical protein N3A38_15050, partial [Planctomycetota bacterium]|nr:hypothetical protein [Planctomycetota bacterium]
DVYKRQPQHRSQPTEGTPLRRPDPTSSMLRRSGMSFPEESKDLLIWSKSIRGWFTRWRLAT